MIKRRRRMDKKKRRCLFGADKKSAPEVVVDEKLVKDVEAPSKKKTKNGRIVASKIEKESIEKSNLIEESKPKHKSLKESAEKKEIEQPLEESTVDLKEDVAKPKSKPSTKTKQR